MSSTLAWSTGTRASTDRPSLVPRPRPKNGKRAWLHLQKFPYALGKERGEPCIIYHVRNVIGKENLITCGRMNELTLLTEYTDSVAKALWLTEQD